MLGLRLLATAFLFTPVPVSLAAPVPKQSPSTAEQLLGSWKLLKADSGLEEGVLLIVNFDKDEKLTITLSAGTTELIRHGTYKADGNKITYTIESGVGVKTEVLTIKKLSDANLHVVDPDGKNEEFSRVKPVAPKMK